MRFGPILACLLLLAAPVAARDRSDAWVEKVVTRISAADRPEPGAAPGPGGSVTIRVRIASDGSLDGVSIDQGSGSEDLDARALRAVRTAAPFAPPPPGLLRLEGYTELSFALRLDPGRKR